MKSGIVLGYSHFCHPVGNLDFVVRLLSVEAGLTGNPTLSVHVLQKILPSQLVELPTLPANIQR